MLFIPAFICFSYLIDLIRYGKFDYQNTSEINDPKITSFLPNRSKDITIYKYYSGHIAKFSIPEKEFHTFLNALWKEKGERSVIPRNNEKTIAKPDTYLSYFKMASWPYLGEVTKHISPTMPNGAGAVYFFNGENQVYNRVNYW